MCVCVSNASLPQLENTRHTVARLLHPSFAVLGVALNRERPAARDILRHLVKGETDLEDHRLFNAELELLSWVPLPVTLVTSA